MPSLRLFCKDPRGATAIEYGLIASLIAVAVIGVLLAIGGKMHDIFGIVSAHLTTS